MKKLISLALIFISSICVAQKVRLNNPLAIEEEAQKQLSTYTNSTDFNKLTDKLKSKPGTYNFKFSMYDNGKVESVRLLEKSEGDIPTQNELLHTFRSFKFKIKTPKNKRYNFEYLVQIN